MTFLHDASTAGQLLGTAVSIIKNARDLAKDSSDHELKNVISDAYDAVLNLKEKLLDLDEENRQLKAQLAKRDSFTGPVPPFGYVYKADDRSKDHPLCPKCFQENGHESFLTAHSNAYKSWRRCPVCDVVIPEKP
jgi:hypothetical protein